MSEQDIIAQPQPEQVSDVPVVSGAQPEKQTPPSQGGAEKLYDNLIKDGYSEKNLGSKDAFIKRVQNPIEANKVYSALRMDGYTQDNLGTMVDFRDRLKKKELSGTGSSGGAQQSRIGSNNFQPSPKPTDLPAVDQNKGKYLKPGTKILGIGADDASGKPQETQPNPTGLRQIKAAKTAKTPPQDFKVTGTDKKAHDWSNIGLFVPHTVMAGLDKDAGQLLNFVGKQSVLFGDNGNETLKKLGEGLEGFGKEHERQAQENALPETTGGRVASGAVGFIPDLIELAATPELDLGKAGQLIAKYGGKYALKGAEVATGKFPTLLATKGLISGYDEAKSKGEDDFDAWKKGLINAGKGYGEGVLYEGAGKIAGKLTKTGSKLLTDAGLMADNKVAAGAEKALLNSSAQAATFSMVPFISNMAQGKDTSLDELKDNAIFGAVTGLFHIPGEDKEAVTPADVASKEIMDRSPAIDLHNFLTADTDAIVTAHNMDVSPADIQAKSSAHAQHAFDETDPEIKQQQIVQSSVNGKLASVKAVANTILENKNDLIDGINELPISDEIKQQVIAKIEEVNKRINPAEQKKQQIGNRIGQIDEAIQNNQGKLQSQDPVERADAEVIDEKLSKERESLEKDLKTTISQEYDRQAKSSEDFAKEQAQQAAQNVVPEKQDEVSAKKPDEAAKSALRQKAIESVTHGIVVPEKIMGQDPTARFDFDMTTAEKQKAVRDIKSGNYETAPAKKMLSKLEEWEQNDNYPIIEGLGGGSVRRKGATSKEIQENIDDAKANKIGELSDRQIAEINKPLSELGFTHQDFIDYENYRSEQERGDRGTIESPTGTIQQSENDKATGAPQDTGGSPSQGIESKIEEQQKGEPKDEPIEKRQQPENDQPKHQGGEEGGKESETGSGNRPEQGGEKQQEVKPKSKIIDNTLIQPSKLKGSKYNLVLAELPDGKFGIVDTGTGFTISSTYDDAVEARLAYSKAREKLTPKMLDDAIKHKTDAQSAAVMALPFMNEFIEHDVKPAVQKIAQNTKEGLKRIVNALSPKTGVSTKAIDLITTNLNSRNEAMTAVGKSVDQIEKMFDKMPDAQRVDFIDRIKRGEKQATPELDQIADMYRQMDKDLYDEIAKYKESLPFKENHFRVLWKTVPGSVEGKERKWFGLAKRPLEGSKGFLKKATLADMSEGIARGGVPLSTNPITLYKAAYADAMKFVTAHRMFDALKENDIVKFVGSGKEIPEGFVPIDDKIARVYFPVKEGLVKAGEWYIEKGPGRMINNYLSRDYIRENPFGKGLMNLKNAYTAAELGLSAYHASAIALEGVSSDIGRGFRKLVNLGLRGNFKAAGEGISDILKAPFSPKTTFSLGRQFIKFATQKDFENSEFGKKFLKQNPEAEQYVHDLFMGGGLMKQNEDLKAHTYKSLKDQMGKDNYIGAAIRAIPALNEMIMSPLFDHYIPAMKVGMFMKEFPLALKENEARIAKGNTTREAVARQTVNFIDDRLGEMNFDNLFWDRTFKTSMQLMLRSVTWKLGNLRAMGGAPIEQATEFYNAAKEKRTPNLSPKMAWVMGLATMQAALSTVTQYMFTGTYPQTIKDLIVPRLSKDDDKQRMMMPTYVKDVTHLMYKGPRDYVTSSLSGDASKLFDIWNNSDFQKYQIYSPDESFAKNIKDVSGYLVPKPISVSSLQKSIEKGDTPEQMAMSFFGFNKAPRYLTEPPIENKIFDMYTMHQGIKSKGQKEQNEIKKQARDLYVKGKGDEAEKVLNDALESGKLKYTQYKSLEKTLGKGGDAATFFFNELPDDDKVYLYKQMSEKERELYDPKGKVADLVATQEEYEKKQETKKKKDEPYSSFKK